MTRSRSAARSDDLPPTLPSMWRVFKLGYRHERGLMFASLSLSLLEGLPDALLALWFKLIADGVQRHDTRLVRTAALLLGVSAAGMWFISTVNTRSSISNDRTISIVWRCCAIRSSCSTTCTRRSSRRAAGFFGWASRSVC